MKLINSKTSIKSVRILFVIITVILTCINMAVCLNHRIYVLYIFPLLLFVIIYSIIYYYMVSENGEIKKVVVILSSKFLNSAFVLG